MGCPIRILKAHRSYAAPLERFAGLRVLHRLGVPRHPPRTLSRLFPPLWGGLRGSGFDLLASASLLFALGKIEVSNQYLVVQCAPFLVLG
jgi:drug/metabolite transporter (DMT)-like permease